MPAWRSSTSRPQSAVGNTLLQQQPVGEYSAWLPIQSDGPPCAVSIRELPPLEKPRPGSRKPGVSPGRTSSKQVPVDEVEQDHKADDASHDDESFTVQLRSVRTMEVVPDTTGLRARSMPRSTPFGVERIVVREEDYRRCGGDLDMLRQCQVPPWVPAPEKAPLASFADMYSQNCRAYVELLDPWRNITEPENIHKASEGDMTINQVWIKPVSHDWNRTSERSYSEDTHHRNEAWRSARRKIALLGRLQHPSPDRHVSRRDRSRGRGLQMDRCDELSNQNTTFDPASSTQRLDGCPDMLCKSPSGPSHAQRSVERRIVAKKSDWHAECRTSSHDDSTTAGTSRGTSLCPTEHAEDHGVSVSGRCSSRSIYIHHKPPVPRPHTSHETRCGWEGQLSSPRLEPCATESRERRAGTANDKPPRAPSSQALVAPVSPLLPTTQRESSPQPAPTQNLLAPPGSTAALGNGLPRVECTERSVANVYPHPESPFASRENLVADKKSPVRRSPSPAVEDRSGGARRGNSPASQRSPRIEAPQPRPPIEAKSVTAVRSRRNRRNWH